MLPGARGGRRRRRRWRSGVGSKDTNQHNSNMIDDHHPAPVLGGHECCAQPRNALAHKGTRPRPRWSRPRSTSYATVARTGPSKPTSSSGPRGSPRLRRGPRIHDAGHVHVRTHRWLVGTHPRTEAARQVGPPRRPLRRPRRPYPRYGRRLERRQRNINTLAVTPTATINVRNSAGGNRRPIRAPT